MHHDRLRIRSVMDVNIVPFKRFNEGFGHSVAFRTRHRGGTAEQAQLTGKVARVFGGITRTWIFPKKVDTFKRKVSGFVFHIQPGKDTQVLSAFFAGYRRLQYTQK